MKLYGKVALIVGGTSGIGVATAHLFRIEGARLIVAGLEQNCLEQAKRELGFFAIQKAIPLMAKGRSIVLTMCFLDAIGATELSVLSASKAAVRSLTRSVASLSGGRLGKRAHAAPFTWVSILVGFGQDYGGPSSSRLALTHPEQITALIV